MTNKELEQWPVTDPPTDAEIGRIRTRAVSLGGAALPLPHRDRSTRFEVQGLASVSPVRVILTSCNKVAQFTAPLDYIKGWQGSFPTESQEDANATKLCVVDDAAHLWPRFQ